MSLPTSRLAYADCIDLLDKCLEAERGIRVKAYNPDKANFFRMRIHMARQIIRNENKEIYEKGDPMWGCSIYDAIVIKIRVEDDGMTWLYLEKISSMDLVIEEITEPVRLLGDQGYNRLQITASSETGEIRAEVLPPIKRRV